MALTPQKAAYILARDGHVCQYCDGEFKNSQLQKHHLLARMDGGSDRPTNLITVCKPCHKKINNGYTMLYGRSTERVCPQHLRASSIQHICNAVKKSLLGDIKDIVVSARRGKMWLAGEAFFIDSVAEAYIEVERTLGKALRKLIPFSLVINRIDFEELYRKHNGWLQMDMLHRRYTWIIEPIDDIGAFRTSGDRNYCVTVMLLKGTSLVAKLAFYPEYELDGAAGVIFESNEDKLGLFCHVKEMAALPREHYGGRQALPANH
jgi:hypothetical protein